ncbi:MAG: PhoH family protein [Fibrobacter sp.]|jgi:phosphate starvation-inducible PhoH-like protein|uniref:PhoH family protein n=1 Tax=Fibrobacter sp. UWCM TaxID=1896208 RepID=UPI000922ADE2|nr:PhoH family protein [Fibrobacter sp. UWCM]MBQ3722072.1 PhoH family protein [Fibrobacter sp.]SHG63348.1 phosphate starvation-inducible protein PhoH [Fibrobacter sp. UWCM]
MISGENEAVFRLLESRFCVEIQSRLPGLTVVGGKDADIQGLFAILDQLKVVARNGDILTAAEVERLLGGPQPQNVHELDGIPTEPIIRNRFGVAIAPKTRSQVELVKAVAKNDVIFAKGPAGTGKTFLAVALAVASLENREAERICLVRPAVEAGETLGFLPGDLKEKIAPYLRPIQDSLSELLPAEKLRRYEESGAIEVAPLAYMRGRTLKRAFIILDEAQNTTVAQMKMFLTRLGPHSKAIITGDTSQVDLAKGEESGLKHAMRILSGIHGIAQITFGATDVLRHPLVKDILLAYEQKEKRK